MKIILIDGLVGNDYAACLAEGLSSSGADVTLIVPGNRKINVKINFKVKYWLPSKERNQSIAKKLTKYFLAQLQLLIYILKNRKCIVHYQFFRRREDIFSMFLFKLINIRIVYTAHNVLPHERRNSDNYFYNFVYKSVDKIIVHSAYIKQKLLKEFNLSERKIYIIPHGNFDFYLPQSLITCDEARNRLNISADENVLLFFGYIRDYKGLDLLIKSFPKASSCNKNLRLLIAGEPGDKLLFEKYEKLINSSESKDKITYYFSYIPAELIQVYFRAADFVILPYKNIDHSGIIHLAYSFSKPIIATKVGDFPETVEEGKSGYLVEENNPDALAKCILKAFSDKNKIKQMGKYAKELSITKYSWNDIAKKTLAAYKN